MIKKIVISLSIFPLLLQLPYIVNAWRTSPLDHWSWFYALTALTLLLLPGAKMQPAKMRFPYLRTLPGIFLSTVLLLGGWLQSIHMIAIIGAMLLPLFVSGYFVSTKRFQQLCPIFGILLLSCPSLVYWLEVFSGLNGLVVQAGIGVGLLTIYGLLRTSIALLKLEKTAFVVCVLLGVSLFFREDRTGEFVPPLLPQFSSPAPDGYWGRKVDQTVNDRNFFVDCEIDRYFFAGDQLNSISILHVTRIGNIHKIHPASHCLRSGGYTVESETTVAFLWQSRNFYVDELIVADGDHRYLYWVWYSNEIHSTSSFLLLRSHFKAADHWQSFQIAIPIDNHKPLDEQRELLQMFVTSFPLLAPPQNSL